MPFRPSRALTRWWTITRTANNPQGSLKTNNSESRTSPSQVLPPGSLLFRLIRLNTRARTCQKFCGTLVNNQSSDRDGSKGAPRLHFSSRSAARFPWDPCSAVLLRPQKTYRVSCIHNLTLEYPSPPAAPPPTSWIADSLSYRFCVGPRWIFIRYARAQPIILNIWLAPLQQQLQRSCFVVWPRERGGKEALYSI